MGVRLSASLRGTATESVTNLGKLLTWEMFPAIMKLNHIYAKK